MTKHKRIKLNMRPSLVDDLIHAYLSGNAPTRASVSESCGVSRASAGKVAKALVESKIMCEKTFSMNGDAPSAHLFVDDDVNVMIIDLSTPRFSLALFDPNAQVKFQATYSYDTSVLFDDNLNIFLCQPLSKFQCHFLTIWTASSCAHHCHTHFLLIRHLSFAI